MSHPRTRPGGSVHTATGEKILAADLDEIGSISLQSLTAFLARLFEDGVSDDPVSGFAGDDCVVTLSVSPLTVSVAPADLKANEHGWLVKRTLIEDDFIRTEFSIR